MTHAKFSPSYLEHAQNCDHYQGGSGGTASERGTSLHERIADALERSDKKHADSQVQYALDFAENIAGRMIDPQFAIEQSLYHSEDCHGTADLIIWENGELNCHVIDWKSGYSEKPKASDCLQIAIYAAMTLVGDEIPCTSAKTYIVEIDQEKHSQASINLSEAHATLRVVDGLCQRIKVGEYINAGMHCKYCKHLPSCPAARRAVDRLPINKNVDLLNNSIIEDALDLSELIKNWIKSVEKRGFRLAEDNQLSRWEIKSGPTIRRWTSEESRAAVFAEMSEILNIEIPPEKTVPVTIAELEKITGKSKKVKTILNPAITWSEGKPKLGRKRNT